MHSPLLASLAPAPAIPSQTSSAPPTTAARPTPHHGGLSDAISAAPPARPPRARPVNTAHSAAARADADRSTCLSPSLPLVLCCTKCQHSSVWFNPFEAYRARRASAEMAPSLLSSSRSTSSAPSSIDTDCADKLDSAPQSPPNAEGLKSPASPSLATEALSDGQTPVVAKFKTESCGQKQSRLLNTQSWVGGEVHGICESCINSSERTMQFSGSSSQGILKQSGATSQQTADPPEPAPRGRSAYPPSLSSEPSFSTSPGSDHSSPSSGTSALERSRSDLQVTWPSCSIFTVDELLAPSLLSQVDPALQKPEPMLPAVPVDAAVSAGNGNSFPVPADSSDGEQPASVTTSKPVTIPCGGQKWHAVSQPEPLPSKSPPRHQVSHLPRSKDHLTEPQLVEISEVEELEDTASQGHLRTVEALQARSQNKLGTSDRNCKSEGTSIRSGTRPSSRSASSHRGANLRSILREAKIPLASEDPGAASRRYQLNTMDIWQVAMIGTPRDRMRTADLPSWQGYSAADRASAQHRRGPSTSSSFRSGHETPQSASHQSIPGSGSIESCMTDLTSFRGESSCERANSCSPTAERPSFSETHGLNLLGRRPSVGRKGSGKDLLTGPPPSDSVMVTSGVERHLSPSSRESHQEVLRTSAVQPPAGRSYTPSEKSPRPSPSTSNLLARFAHFHQASDKAAKDARRRPSTATGSATPSARPSPKPGSNVHGPLSPMSVSTGSSTLSPPLPNACLPSAVELDSSRSSKLQMFKRPATATGSGSTTEPIALSIHNSPVHARPFTANKASPSTFTPYSSTSGTSSGTQFPGLQLDYDFTLPVPGGPGTMHRRMSSGEERLGVSASPTGHREPPAEPGPALTPVSKSVPNTPVRGHFYGPRRAGLHAADLIEELAEPVGRRMQQESAALSKLPPEDFYSKSRNLNLSILPRPSSGMFRPGQRVSIYVRLAAKVKARKYNSISLVLLGSAAAESEGGGGSGACGGGHEFLRQSFAIHPSTSEGVRVVSGGLDTSEWQIELTIPQYATCACKPGPLPLPSSGSQGGAGHQVGYSIQLSADRKQLLAAQESVNVKFHLASKAEARYLVTTKAFTSSPRTGKIAFAGGYLGAIESYSLSHQLYYQSAERLRIGYQFEIELSPHSFLPLTMAEEVCKTTKVGIRSLVGEQTQLCGLSFVDHRSKVIMSPAEPAGETSKWTIKGYLEVKNVPQQMEFLRATLETTQRGAGRHTETAVGPSSAGGSGFGMLMRNKYSSSGVPSTASGTGLMRSGMAGAMGGGSGHGGTVQLEAERQARLSTSQLLLVATTEHCPGAFARPIEVTSLIGSELVSGCPLRRIGEETLKRTVMEEKMKKVQEEHLKNS